jgi:basic membrane protein A
MRFRHVGVAALAAMSIAAAGCGGDEEAAAPAASGDGGDAAAEALSVGMALPGPINDRGYNQGLFSGLEEVESSLGAEVSHVESLADPAAALDAVKNLARANQLVIIAGGQFSDIAVTAAKANPDTQFAIVDGVPKEQLDNLHPFPVNYRQNGYLAGIAATKLTQSKKVAFVGGIDIPPVQLSQAGFTAGVDAGGGVEAAAVSTGSFNDAGAAKESSAAQIAAGADVLFPFVDAAYTGTTGAAEEAGDEVKVIVSNRSTSVCDESPSIVGATTVDYPAVVNTIVEAFQGGEMATEPTILGVEQDILGLDLCPGRSDEAVAEALDETAAGIKDGSVTVPQG